MEAFTVTLVRHGETNENSKRQLQGRSNTPLSTLGTQQATDLGSFLTKVKFTKALASPLQRALHTAQLVISQSENPLQIETDPRLMERGFGEAEGKFVPDVIAEAKSAGLPFHLYNPAGAETFQEVLIRAESFFEYLCDMAAAAQDNGKDENLLVVSHGGWIAALMRHLHLNGSRYQLRNFDAENALRIPRNTSYHQFTIRRTWGDEPGAGFVVEIKLLHEVGHTVTNDTSFGR